jgi:hypothetical protein
MTSTPAITAMLNAFITALTPMQRWEAAGRFDNSGIMAERWFIITQILVLSALCIALFAVSYHRKMQERKTTNQLFARYAEKRGLSEQECQILLNIAGNAGLRRRDAIFTTSSAFDRGAAKIIEKSLAYKQPVEESKQLIAELSYLREKLGFQNKNSSSVGAATKTKKLNSRQIPTGKKLRMTRRKSRASNNSEIESTVIENNDMELKVKLTTPVEITPGELWRVHYYFGASVWEFDTSVVSCEGDILVLSHSNKVRFINRRRFPRVPVSKTAFVAQFPFSRMITRNIESKDELPGPTQGSANALDDSWGPPKFAPAVITEMAALGLRIETPLEVNKGERILVIFELDEESSRKNDKTLTTKIVEDIAEVKHVQIIQNGLSIAVELTGLNDSDINELIRATNIAALRTSTKSKDAPNSVNEEERALEPASVEGT